MNHNQEKIPNQTEEGKKIYVTRNGEAYHLKNDCRHLKNYVYHERTPCEECRGSAEEVLNIRGSSSSNREETALIITAQNKKYHHPTCDVVWGSRSKDKRIRCIDCEIKERNRNAEEERNERKARKKK